MASHVNNNLPAGGSGASTNPLTGLLLSNGMVQQRYRVLDVLSTDAISTVYKAEDTLLGNRFVTLKEIGKNIQHTSEALQLIETSKRKLLLLAGLIHPNLPRVYDYFVENQRWYFVIDFLPGETLETYLSQRKRHAFSVEELLDVGLQLSTVLDFLHMHHPPLGFTELTLNDIWRTPDGKYYLLTIGTPLPTRTLPENNSIYSLGKILRQLQHGKPSKRPRRRFVLPHFGHRPKNMRWLKRSYRRQKHPQSVAFKMLLRRMLQEDQSKKPYTTTMTTIKEELQHLALQPAIPKALKQRVFSRRTLFRVGGFIGLGILAGASSQLAWHLELSSSRAIPHPNYTPGLGGTLYTYDASSAVYSVAWSPNGTRIVLGDKGNQVLAWDANSGHHVVNYTAPELVQSVQTVIWLPDGSSIVAGGDDAVVWVWNEATGNVQTAYHGHSSQVITVASSPDSRYIASGGVDQTVQVWEAATGNVIVNYHGHSGSVGSVCWSPDGKYIASASFDKTVQVWEAATGRPLYTYSGHTNKVYAVAWSPDGRYIASGGLDLTVQVWPVSLFESAAQDRRQHHSIIMYRGHSRAIQDIAWSPNGREIASAADNVQLWNALTGQHIYTYTKHAIHIALEVQAVQWSPNGRYMASGGIEGTVQVWNAK
jgi:WD40 repeat protein